MQISACERIRRLVLHASSSECSAWCHGRVYRVLRRTCGTFLSLISLLWRMFACVTCTSFDAVATVTLLAARFMSLHILYYLVCLFESLLIKWTTITYLYGHFFPSVICFLISLSSLATFIIFPLTCFLPVHSFPTTQGVFMRTPPPFPLTAINPPPNDPNTSWLLFFTAEQPHGIHSYSPLGGHVTKSNGPLGSHLGEGQSSDEAAPRVTRLRYWFSLCEWPHYGVMVQ